MRVSFLPNPPNKGPPAQSVLGGPLQPPPSLWWGPSHLRSRPLWAPRVSMPILPESPYRAQHLLLVRVCVMKKSCTPAVLSSNVFSEQGRRAV